MRRLVEGARRAKQRNPRLRRKRLPKPLFPGAAERRYRRYVEAIAVRLAEMVRERLFPRLPRIAAEAAALRPTADGVRLDAWADELEAILEDIRQQIDAEFDEPETFARGVARDVSDWNGDQLQKTIRAAFNTEVAIPEPWIRDTFESFVVEQAKLIRSVPEQFISDVSGILQRGFRAGTPHEQLARDVRGRFDIPKHRAATLARTSVAQLNSTLTKLRNQEMGVTHYVWRTALDDRVRPSHMAKEGERYAWNDPPKDTGHPGMDFNCFPGDALAFSESPIRKAYRRWYSGDLTELVTESGETLRATPNHPVLTGRGWVPTKLVEVGEYLFQAPRQGVEVFVGNPEYRQAPFAQLFRAAQLASVTQRVAGRAMWFHGDGTDKQVDVVDVDRRLGNERDAAFLERVRQQALAVANAAILSERASAQFVVGALHSTYGVMRGARESLTLVGAQSSHADQVRLAAVANGYSRSEQARPDGAAGYGVLLRDRQFAAAGQVFGYYLGVWEFSPIVRAAPRPVRVVDRITRRFDGHVFNLETDTGWYTVGGLIVHNCRCIAEPDVSAMIEATERSVEAVG